jgi:hypothetical protein
MQIRNIHMDVVGWIFFGFFSVLVVIGLPLYIILIIGSIIKVIYSGFSLPAQFFLSVVYLNLLFLLCLLSTSIPVFRKIYYVFPWLLPFVKVLSIDAIVIMISFWIINKGFESNIQLTHIKCILASIFICIICRFFQCLYFKYRKPIALGGRNE